MKRLSTILLFWACLPTGPIFAEEHVVIKSTLPQISEGAIFLKGCFLDMPKGILEVLSADSLITVIEGPVNANIEHVIMDRRKIIPPKRSGFLEDRKDDTLNVGTVRGFRKTGEPESKAGKCF